MNISPISGVNAARTQATNSNDQTVQALIAAEYSARAGGKTYSANVDRSAEGYSATVANLPGASASGNSIQQVENNLGNLISFFA